MEFVLVRHGQPEWIRDGLNVDTPPRLTDFAFSAGVERMARVALGLYKREGDVLGCTLLKQTEGPSGFDFDLNFDRIHGVVAPTPLSAAMREMQREQGLK